MASKSSSVISESKAWSWPWLCHAPSPPLKIFSSSGRSEKGVLGLCWEGRRERKQRKCKGFPVSHSFSVGKENINIRYGINSGEKVKRRRVNYLRGNISCLKQTLGPDVRSPELLLGPSNQLGISTVQTEQNIDVQLKKNTFTLFNFPVNSSWIRHFLRNREILLICLADFMIQLTTFKIPIFSIYEINTTS